MLKYLLYALILVLGFPVGLLLAVLCRDEIKAWRKRFLIISAIALILSVGVYAVFPFVFLKISVIVSLFFIIVVCMTLFWKSVNVKR